MNWQEKFVQIIMKQYPKSIALIKGNFKSSQVWKLQYMSTPRLLYDFFDKQGIYIGIEILFYDAAFYYMPHIVLSNLDLDNQILGSETRTEAEEQAFMKAFEILEERLK